MQIKPSPIQEISSLFLQRNGVRMLLKRDDLLHPEISGNKWRKLKFNLLKFKESEAEKLLTFGGAFSNHIAAVAAAGKAYDFPTVGIIRGELVEPLNPTLMFAKKCGMHLKSISRTAYRQKKETAFLENLRIKFGDFYTLPEGGSNVLAIKGCREIITEAEEQLDTLPDYFCVSCGTGGTVAGMIAALQGRAKILGFSALKGDFLTEEVSKLLTKADCPIFDNWQINTDYHFGGYAKWKPALIQFINDFKEQNGVALDPIYTGKLLFGVYDLIEKGYFQKGATILVIHTGGIQGIKGFNARFGELLK